MVYTAAGPDNPPATSQHSNQFKGGRKEEEMCFYVFVKYQIHAWRAKEIERGRSKMRAREGVFFSEAKLSFTSDREYSYTMAKSLCVAG